MNPLERVMRLMTQLNIAATLATAGWVLWSGLQIVIAPPTGPLPVRPAPVSTGLLPAAAPSPTAVRLPAAAPACHQAADPQAAPANPSSPAPGSPWSEA